MDNKKTRNLMEVLGPGLLFAAASVGVSHVVQSTRAGAIYGFSALLLVIIVNMVKYPAFRVGTEYTLATGMTLLQGYKNIGRWALGLYGVLMLAMMPLVFAAICLVTSGAVISVTGIDASLAVVSPIILICSGALLMVGGYSYLETLVKILVVIFSVLTLLATVVALLDFSRVVPAAESAGLFSPESLFFLIAFIGWMPTGLESSVWQSLWTLEKSHRVEVKTHFRAYLADFNIGYSFTVLLAACFIILGHNISLQSGAGLSANASLFIAQIIEIYSSSIGEWCVPLVGLCIFSVLFSTMITVLDGFPRALAMCLQRLRADEVPWSKPEMGQKRAYMAFMAAGILVAYGLVLFSGSAFKILIDFVTTVAFFYAPVVAVLNLVAMKSRAVPEHLRPSRAWFACSLSCILLLVAFAAAYVALLIL